MPRRLGVGVVVVVALLSVLDGSAPAGAQASDLLGTFRLAAGTCSGGGTFFRMILPSGTAAGPFVANEDSACADKTITTLAPGSDGGLVTGQYQPATGFDANGNSRSSRIARPAAFFGVQFGLSTNSTDPQSGQAVAAPAIRVEPGGRLTADVSAFAASWNNQEFNQGAPKPGGGRPGLTSGPTGTYDVATGQFVLEWASQIIGGPFNNFTGQWRLAGTFAPAAGVTAGSAPPAGPAGAPAATATTAPVAAATTSTIVPTTTTLPSTASSGATSASPDAAAPAPQEVATEPITRSTTAVPLWTGVTLLALGAVLVLGGLGSGWIVRRGNR